MNVAAIESMEYFAKTVNGLSKEAQTELFVKLAETLSFEDVETLKRCVGFYRLFTTPSLYRAMQEALGEELYKEFNA